MKTSLRSFWSDCNTFFCGLFPPLFPQFLSFLQSLLSVHDVVAQKSYDPELPPLPEGIEDDEDSVKIIRLVKNKEPLVSNLFFLLSSVISGKSTLNLWKRIRATGRFFFYFLLFKLKFREQSQSFIKKKVNVKKMKFHAWGHKFVNKDKISSRRK